ncbi:hypothetical protein CYLTODRAFT_426137 [Cylindrobasidium torrendii FP15055 ss-10]|uniref:F-box domain-containing protein n=1 Tax=Cylindrobasidium torrendii FP15055 ss-10 TaxID=1314674 RepID=A0A0D7B1K7_9AGAR|nr:hypothetical protein CYLTODRAFT_426137 [Cylindrobasidium torrendii FP15055 ss-10]
MTRSLCAACSDGAFPSFAQHEERGLVEYAAAPPDTPGKSNSRTGRRLQPLINLLTRTRTQEPEQEKDKRKDYGELVLASPASPGSSRVETIRRPRQQVRQLSFTEVGLALAAPSAISRLPAEILALVFVFAVDGSEEWRTALRLSLVSRFWRNIALGRPQLWTTVVSRPRGMHAGTVWWYLHLSQQDKLDVTLDMRRGGGSDAVVSQILREVGRWKSVDIRLPGDDTRRIDGIPFELAKELKTLMLDEGTCKAAMSRGAGSVTPHPWPTVDTVVLLQRFTNETNLSLVSAKHLILENGLHFARLQGTESPTPLGFAKLTIRTAPIGVDRFLRSYSFVGLTSVEVVLDLKEGSKSKEHVYVKEHVVPALISAIRSSVSQLRSLTLKGVPFDVPQLLELLCMTRKLRTFVLHGAVNHDLIRNLSVTMRDADGAVLPRLKRLELVWDGEVDGRTVLDSLESRMSMRTKEAGLSALKSVVLGRIDGKPFDDATVERMNDMRRTEKVAMSQW